MKTDGGRGNLSETLGSLAAKCLKVPADELERDVPLTRYGLDSMATIELTAALERALDLPLSDTVLLEYPDLQSLERYLASAGSGPLASGGGADQMRDDSVLPADIRPAAPPVRGGATPAVLLTGATGFLGSFLLKSLLRKTKWTVCCLARPAGGRSGGERIRATMQSYGIWSDEFDRRIEVFEGDLASPLLGLDKEGYEALASGTEAVYHAGADVNWVYSYGALRRVNVWATRELLRLACAARTKPFCFVSSIGVCYSTAGPREVGEDDDMHPYLRGLHLGYAQSKCVAEELVRQAGKRGVPFAIFRPSLITGDRSSGAVHTDDFLSRLIKAMVLMRVAPDLDWVMDCCPVDYVADAIVALSRDAAPECVYHLVNPSPRHWREFILWMNFYGYDVGTVPYRDWLGLLLENGREEGHPLRELLPFFSTEVPGEGGLTLPELHEESRRSHVSGERTRSALEGLSLGTPRLGADLLDRYFQEYVDSGFLPGTFGDGQRGKGGERTVSDTELLSGVLRDFLERENIEVLEVRKERLGSEHSIISELTSWKYGNAAGLDRCRVLFSGDGGDHEELTVIVKRKVRDEHAIDVAVQVAGYCSPGLGRAFARHRGGIGLAGSHVREIGIYRQGGERFHRHVPVVMGSRCDDAKGEWILVLEDISGLDMIDSADNRESWSGRKIESVIRGLATLHSIWLGREQELRGQVWIGPIVDSARRARMEDLWSALAEEAGDRFCSWGGSEMRKIQARLVGEVNSRWRRLDQMPLTLIHNDFNTRNIALRSEDETLRLCAYDWELATVGVPQHDLAEFLCFALSDRADLTEVSRYLELHRSAIEEEAQVRIDRHEWEEGFRLSLHDLLVDRFGMYAIVDRFRPMRFLPRVVSNWRRLYELFAPEEVRRR